MKSSNTPPSGPRMSFLGVLLVLTGVGISLGSLTLTWRSFEEIRSVRSFGLFGLGGENAGAILHVLTGTFMATLVTGIGMFALTMGFYLAAQYLAQSRVAQPAPTEEDEAPLEEQGEVKA